MDAKKIVGSPPFFIAGIAVFGFGLWHFTRLAILPRLPKAAAQ